MMTVLNFGEKKMTCVLKGLGWLFTISLPPFQVLLMDPCPTVRVTAVQGVCRICNVFWELIPVATISAFLNKLTHELAWDGASPDVRVAVIKVKSALNSLNDA